MLLWQGVPGPGHHCPGRGQLDGILLVPQLHHAGSSGVGCLRRFSKSHQVLPESQPGGWTCLSWPWCLLSLTQILLRGHVPAPPQWQRQEVSPALIRVRIVALFVLATSLPPTHCSSSELPTLCVPQELPTSIQIPPDFLLQNWGPQSVPATVQAALELLPVSSQLAVFGVNPSTAGRPCSLPSRGLPRGDSWHPTSQGLWGLRACARGMLTVIVVDPMSPLHIEWEKGGNSALGDKRHFRDCSSSPGLISFYSTLGQALI